MTRRLASASGTYSDAVAVAGPGTWVHIAGQLGVQMDGAGSDRPRAEQARIALLRIEQLLGDMDASLSDVVKVTVFVTDFDDYAEVSRVRSAIFGDLRPASTAVQVAGLLAGAAIEIEALAFVAA
jgi:enamine deaminase RidA (YjgF/YER057c/UK114 family)